jgi:hypothetical protein
MPAHILPHERDVLIQTAARLQRLAADMIAIAEGSAPTDADLANAPILDRYVVCETTVQCLMGFQSGHPVLTGKLIETSELHLMSVRDGWARTTSRYYRLGRPRLAPLNG